MVSSASNRYGSGVPSLILGPVLRHVGSSSGGSSDGCWATVWVEVDSRCRVQVRCGSGHAAEAWTFEVEGHFYALVVLEGLPPDAVTTYSVHLLAGADGGADDGADDGADGGADDGADDGADGSRVWPAVGLTPSGAPESVIRTPATGGSRRVVFGSCRAPAAGLDDGASGASGVGANDPLGVDALDAFAVRAMRAAEGADGAGSRRLPDLLLMLGDQVYADETSEATREKIVARRGPDPGIGRRGMFRRGHLGAGLEHPPGAQVADFEEYTWLYLESWGTESIRWLLSTVPVAMIFDDHDVHDDWNTSAAWRTDMADLRWWPERIVGGLMSYWVYQHIGNLSPDELAADPMYRQVLGLAQTGDDAGPVLRAFAAAADAAVGDRQGGYRWSFWRDLGPLRLVVLDSRCGRVLIDGERSMLADATFDWLAERLAGDYRHLAIGTSVPWLLNPTLQAVEAWDERLADRAGRVRSGLGEQIRRALDLEHWAAFRISFERLADLLRGVTARPDAPATISLLSGDVHHSYVSAVELDPTSGSSSRPGSASASGSRVYQLTCSPVHNQLPESMRRAFRLLWSRAATRAVDVVLHRWLRVPRPSVGWRTLDGPFFGNCMATLELADDQAVVTLETTDPPTGRPGPTLHPVATRPL